MWYRWLVVCLGCLVVVIVCCGGLCWFFGVFIG